MKRMDVTSATHAQWRLGVSVRSWVHAGVATACALLVFLPVTAAATTVIQANQVFPDSDQGVGGTRVVVDGNRTRYNQVKTDRVSIWVRMQGHAPARAQRHNGSRMEIGSFVYEFSEPAEGRVYRIDLPYQPPRGGSFDAVLFCNGKLNDLSGDARSAFLRDGGIFDLRNAYDGELKSSWWVADKPGPGFRDPPSLQTWENRVEVIAQIRCAPLDPNAGLTRSNPSPSAAPSPRRTNPSPPDAAAAPRLKTATLSIAAYEVQSINGHRCPTKLRLRGFIESNRAMRGQVVFVGPQFLSAPKPFDFEGAQTMNHIASYTLAWGAGASGSLSAGGGASPRQDLAFKFNVVNRNGKLVESVEESIRVTCE